MNAIISLLKLTKPGVLFGNAITVPAGFLLASQGQIDWWLLAAVFGGTTLVIASACVLNNYLDQDIDSRMERTKKRPLVAGDVPGWAALWFAILLGVIGFWVLVTYTNLWVVATGVVGYIDYIWLYGMLSKRKSIHGTLVGSISGAMPILAGYLGASNQFDIGALLVFGVLFLWQMPEFYSIAIYRRKEYEAAKVPVISVVKGVDVTRRQIIFYTATFSIVSLLLWVSGVTGITYVVAMGLACLYWLWLALKGLRTDDIDRWAKQMFRFSLIVLLLFCLLIFLEPWIP